MSSRVLFFSCIPLFKKRVSKISLIFELRLPMLTGVQKRKVFLTPFSCAAYRAWSLKFMLRWPRQEQHGVSKDSLPFHRTFRWAFVQNACGTKLNIGTGLSQSQHELATNCHRIFISTSETHLLDFNSELWISRGKIRLWRSPIFSQRWPLFSTA